MDRTKRWDSNSQPLKYESTHKTTRNQAPPRQITSGIELITDHQHVKDVGNK